MPETLSSDATHAAEYDSEGATDTLVWRLVKYKLKLGLKGWIVKEIVLPDPYEGNSNSNDFISEDLHDQQKDDSNQQSIAQKMSELKNPEVEETEQGIMSGIEILHKRLAEIGYKIFQIRASPAVINMTFSRSKLNHTFGGRIIDTFSKIQIDRLPQSLRGYVGIRFMCLNALYNAHCPQKPGAPGLYYALRDLARWPNAQELVFTRYGANRWNFMGIYNITRSQQLSAEEFQSLSSKVQDTWFSNIWSHKWGDYTLAAIYLRKHRHAEPTDMEVEYYAKKKAALIHRKVTSNDVKQAFLSGAEKINVWTMKCIGYDEELKKRLVPAQSRQQRKRKASKDGRSRVSKHRRT
ncbi:hypothetical protein ACEPAH_6202 [Sanghuangporus vaninii]